MQLEWMGEYRDVLEKLIHYCNVYAAVYKKEMPPIEGVSFSFSQIQVVEYLLENEELNQNMSTIALRLGITFSTFSKMVNKLEEKGLLEKFYLEGNKKNIVIHVSALGKRVYTAYVQEIMSHHFGPMFEVLQQIPRESLDLFAKALANPFPDPDAAENSQDKPVLIPCKSHNNP